jgi:replicative DNA helicase
MTGIVSEREVANIRGYISRLTPGGRIALASMLRESVDVGGRVPPHNHEAEQAVISVELTDGRRLDEIFEVLPDGDAFYGDAHRRIHSIARELHAKGQPVDITTVSNVLKQREQLQAVGGFEYLADVVDKTPSVANVAAHAKIVREKAQIRSIAAACSMIAAECHGDYADGPSFLASAAEKVAAIGDVGRVSRVQLIDAIGRERDAKITAQWRGEREPWGMRGPHERLHLLMQGFGLGEQTYVAADTGGGKSAYALQIARDLAGRTFQRERIGCGYLSLEMLSENHYDRAIIAETHALAKGVRPPTMGEYMTGREATRGPDGRPGKPGKDLLDPARVLLIEEARREIQSLPIAFDDSAQDIASVRACVRKMQSELRAKGATLRLVVIDHMHVMDFPDARREDEAIAIMVKGFNNIAKDLGLHLMVLAQFNRGASASEGPPRREHIRGSAAIEQIAHKILILHRPWTRMSIEQKRKASEAEQREAYAILAKHRNGKEGATRMLFTGEAFRFDEADEEYDDAA